MNKKKQRPDSNARMSSPRRTGKVIFLRVPETLKNAINEAIKHEVRVRGHRITYDEWLARAAIDRLGEIFGTSVANQFYKQFFNGIAAVESEIHLPTATGTNESNQNN